MYRLRFGDSTTKEYQNWERREEDLSHRSFTLLLRLMKILSSFSSSKVSIFLSSLSNFGSPYRSERESECELGTGPQNFAEFLVDATINRVPASVFFGSGSGTCHQGFYTSLFMTNDSDHRSGTDAYGELSLLSLPLSNYTQNSPLLTSNQVLSFVLFVTPLLG